MSQRKAKASKALQSTATQQQLPFWPDDLRGLPWATLRSALFAPVQRGARAAVERKEVATVGDFRIIYTGFQLDQADLDVYQQVLQWAREVPLGQPVRFRTRELLQAIGRSTGKSGRDWLLRSLDRLKANSVEVAKGDLSYSGSLIQQQARDDEAGMHYVILEPSLSDLYAQGYSVINADTRMALGRNQLAKWLHGFVQGQQKPLTFDVARLMELANSHRKRPRNFCHDLDVAAELIRECGADVVLRWDSNRHQVTLSKAAWLR